MAFDAFFKKDARNRTSLDVNEPIGEALAHVRDELQKHHVSVQVELNEQLPRIRGDQVQVQQALLNLITNAIDATAAKTWGADALRQIRSSRI
jgi:signal transduction histidine kinase